MLVLLSIRSVFMNTIHFKILGIFVYFYTIQYSYPATNATFENVLST